MPERPAVTCVMLTRHGRRFATQAIWYFLRQDYPARELIVVDDGEDDLGDLFPGDPRIRYVRLPASSAGAKRNLAASLARGQVIAHWDDDTWYSPQRLTAQVHMLQQTGAEVTALDRLLHYQPVTGRVWQLKTNGHGAAPHAGTLLYRRAYGQAHPFPENGRDGAEEFVRRVPAGRLSVQDGARLAVAVLHGGGTSGVNPADPRWQPRPFDDLSGTLALDLAFYARLRGGPAAGRGRHDPVPITLAATFMVYDGYGSMAEYLALGLVRAGADVRVAPFRIDPVGISPELRELWQGARTRPEGLVLCHAWWGDGWTTPGPSSCPPISPPASFAIPASRSRSRWSMRAWIPRSIPTSSAPSGRA
ncbi:MAG: glycosyltransferase family A protein [Anaerolineae bacterium]